MPPYQLQSVTLIYSPYHVGVLNHEVGAGPNRLRDHGILSALEYLNIDVKQAEVKPIGDAAEGDIGRYFEVLRQTSRLGTLNHFPSFFLGTAAPLLVFWLA